MNKDQIAFYRNMTNIMHGLLSSAYDDSDEERIEHRIKWAVYEMEMLVAQINKDLNMDWLKK
jgi:hypothetical protein